MKLFWIFIYLILTHSSRAQICIQAIIKDSESHKPLIYANIQLKGHNSGTITNYEGKFKLYIPVEEEDDSLLLSFVSYKSQIIPIRQLSTDSLNLLYLCPEEIYISTIDVFGLRAEEVLRKTHAQINSNYLTLPSTQKAYFREIIYQNGAVEKFSDANLLLRKESYGNKKTDKMEYLAGRNHKNLKKSPMWEYIYFVNGTYESLHCDIIKYPHSFILIPSNSLSFFNPRKFKFYNYRINLESDEFYVIEFSPRKKRAIYKGQLIVDKHDFALLVCYYYIVPSALDRISLLRYDTKSFLNEQGVENKAIYYSAYCIYQKYGDKYSLQQAGLSYQTLFYSQEHDFVSNITMHDQLVINSIDTTETPEIPFFKRISAQSSVHKQIARLKNKAVDSLPIIVPEKNLKDFLKK